MSQHAETSTHHSKPTFPTPYLTFHRLLVILLALVCYQKASQREACFVAPLQIVAVLPMSHKGGWSMAQKQKATRSVNPCAKKVTPENAYEVWQSFDGSWTYFVLKKYQSPEKEAKNPYAIWYVLTKSPYVPNGEFGDIYVSTVKRGTHQIDNPLHRTICVKGTFIQALDALGLSKYPVTDLMLRDVRLWQYLKISVPPKDFEKVKRLLEEHEIAIVCMDAADFLERCLTDVQTSGKEHTT